MNANRLEQSPGDPSSEVPAAGAGGGENLTLWRKVLDQRLDLGGGEAPVDQATLRREIRRAEAGGPDGELLSVEEQTAAWREQLLQALTYSAGVVGLPVVAAAIYGAYAGDRPILIPFWAAAYAALLLPLAWSRIPQRVHAGSFVGLLLGVGLLSSFQPGFYGDGKLFFLSGAALATVLLGRREGTISLLAAFAAHALVSWGGHAGLLVSPPAAASAGGLARWWWSGPLFVLLLGAGMILAETHVGQRLVAALQRCQSLREDLADHEDELLSRELDVERQGARLKTVEELGRLTVFELDPDRVVRRIEEAVQGHMPCDSVNVFMAEEPGNVLKLHTATGPAAGEAEAGTATVSVGDSTVVGWVAEQQEAHLIRDAHSEAREAPFPHTPEAVSEVAVPMVVGCDLVGVLDVQAKEKAAFDEADVRFLTILASWATLALENQRHLSDAYLEGDPIHAAGSRLSAAATQHEVVDAIADLVAETKAGTCLVTEFSRDIHGEIESLICLKVWRRDGKAVLRPGTQLPLASSPFPKDLLDGTWQIADVGSDDRLSVSARRVFEQMGVGGLVSFPLRGRNGVFGQVLALYADPVPFSQRTRQLLELLEDRAGLALERGQRMDDLYLRARREELASKTAVRMHESLDVQSVLNTAVRDIGETLGLAAVKVQLGPVSELQERGSPVGGDGDGGASQDRNGKEE